MKEGAVYVSLLRFCIERRALCLGRRLHRHFGRHSLLRQPDHWFVATLLLQTYANCGSVGEARSLLDSSSSSATHNSHLPPLWNAMITAYAQNGHYRESLSLYRRRLRCSNSSRRTPDRFAFSSLLSACGGLRSLPEGKVLHAHALAAGFLGFDAVLETALLRMYAKCGRTCDARAVFENMQTCDAVAWTALIEACGAGGCTTDALAAFGQMASPDKVAHLCALAACACPVDCRHGKTVHASLARSGLESDPTLLTALISMYGKSRHPSDARKVFDAVPRASRTLPLTNAILSAYAGNSLGKEALQLYRLFALEDLKEGMPVIEPDRFTFLCLAKACSSPPLAEHARSVHLDAVARGFSSDTALLVAFINMYGKCGCPHDARAVFDMLLRQCLILPHGQFSIHLESGFPDIPRALPNTLPEWYPMRLESSIPDTPRAVPNMLQEHYPIHPKSSIPDVPRVVPDMLLEQHLICPEIGIPDTPRAIPSMLLELYPIHSENGITHTPRVAPTVLQEQYLICPKSGIPDTPKAVPNTLQEQCSIRPESGFPYTPRAVSDTLQGQYSIPWNVMLTAYGENGHHEEVLTLFWLMEMQGVEPDDVTFLCLLTACTGLQSPETGRVIHGRIVASGLQLELAVQNALLNMYGKCGGLKQAQAVFDRMHHRNLISWNAMLTSYAQDMRGAEAFELFGLMGSTGPKPDKVSFLSLLNVCSGQEYAGYGRALHACILMKGFGSDVAVMNALLNAYSKCGSLEEARALFDQMRQRDLISWNTMLVACARNDRAQQALELFRQMNREGVEPDKCTAVCLLNVCADLASLETGREIHECAMAGGFDLDQGVMNALVNMYGKCGSIKEARKIFDGMAHRCVVSWNAMLATYAQNKRGREALQLFEDMGSQGVKPDKVTFLALLHVCANLPCLETGRKIHRIIRTSGHEFYLALNNALLSMYGKCGSLMEARMVFDGMMERDVVSWNAMLCAYGQNACGKEALKLFRQMELEGVKPDRVTFLCLLNACAHCADITSLGNWRAIHERILVNGLNSDVAVKNALLDMYGKCGGLEEARAIFSGMVAGDRNIVSWNAMLATTTRNGHAAEALELSRWMDCEGVHPDKVTYLCLLDACANLGCLESGRTIHKRAFGDGLELDDVVKNALLDMYGKCGSVTEARVVFDGFDDSRCVVTFNAMLTAYAHNGHVSEALKLFQQMEYEGVNADRVTFLCLLSACSHAGLWDEGWQHFITMSDRYDITASKEHYACMIDLLERAMRSNEEEDMMRNVPVWINAKACITLLDTCHAR